MTLAIGTRLYNGGDMANPDHFGTLTNIRQDKWGTHYEITPDPDSTYTTPYWVDDVIISPTYSGNGSTRIVTEAAYQAWRDEQTKKLQAWIAKTAETP